MGKAPINFIKTAKAVFVSADESIYEQMYLAAATDLPVLILGETGTGKELIAKIIGQSEKWKNKPFETINCVLYPRDLLYSELFGHTMGAFTGAATAKKGIFERNLGGTVFIVEVGDFLAEAKAGILRFLETKDILPLGPSSRTTSASVRVIVNYGYFSGLPNWAL